MDKIDAKKWATGSVVYNPVEDEIALVTGGVEWTPNNMVIVMSYAGLRQLIIYPVGTEGVVEWAYLGDVNG